MSKLERVKNIMGMIAYGIVILILPIMLLQALPLLGRAVTVLENMDKRVERVFDGAKPIGQEAVRKGVHAMRNVDGKKIGETLTDAINRKIGGKK